MSGGSATSTTASNTATIALPNTPAAGDAQLVFWSSDASQGTSAPSISGSLLGLTTGSYTAAASGSAAVYAGAASDSTITLSLSSSQQWGVITIELEHS